MVAIFPNTSVQTEKKFEFFNSTECTPNQEKAEKESVLIEDYFLQILLSKDVAQSKSFDFESLLHSLCTLKFKSVKSFLSKLISSEADKYTKGYAISLILQKYKHEEFKKLLNEVDIDLLTKNIFNDITNYTILKGCWQILLLWLLNQKQTASSNTFLYIFLSKVKKVKEINNSYFSFLHGTDALLRAKCIELDFQLLKDIGEIILTLAKFREDSGISLPLSEAFETHLQMLLSKCDEGFGEKIGSLSPQLQQAWLGEKVKRIAMKQQEKEVEEKKKEVVSIRKIIQKNPEISVEDACIALAHSQEKNSELEQSVAEINAELIEDTPQKKVIEEEKAKIFKSEEIVYHTLGQLIYANYQNLLLTEQIKKSQAEIYNQINSLENEKSNVMRHRCVDTLLQVINSKEFDNLEKSVIIKDIAFNWNCPSSLQRYIAEELVDTKESQRLFGIISQKEEELERSDIQKSIFTLPSGEKTRVVVKQEGENNITSLQKTWRFLNTDISKLTA